MNSKLQAKLYKNAVLLPVNGAENGPLLPGAATGGVCNSNGVPIKYALLNRRYRKHFRLNKKKVFLEGGRPPVTSAMVVSREPGVTVNNLKGRYLFAGYLFSHYGHCLLESLSRLWCIKKFPDIPLLWLGVHNQKSFNDVNRQLFEILGVGNEMQLLSEQTRVEELIIPEVGYVIHTNFASEQALAMQVLPQRKLQSGKKVWLSRSLVGRGGIINENELEKMLCAKGWTIYHAQQHTIQNQLEMLADAERISGFDGSAFHTLMMMPCYQGRIDVFRRRDFVNLDIYLISNTFGHNLYFHHHHFADLEIVTPELPDWTANRKLDDLDHILKLL